MKRDPIVEEVHRIRQQMWDQSGGDLDRLIDSLRSTEAEHPDRIISPENLKQMRQTSRQPLAKKP